MLNRNYTALPVPGISINKWRMTVEEKMSKLIDCHLKNNISNDEKVYYISS